MKSRYLVLLGILALGLLVLPWVPLPNTAPHAGPVTPGGEIAQQLLACAEEVEQAVAGGKVQQLRSAVTVEHLEEINTVLTSVDRRMIPGDLKALGALHGSPRELEFVCGVVRGDVAVLVFGRVSSVVTGLPGVLRGWRFVWDGWRWRLDGVQSAGAGADVERMSEQGDALLQRLLRR